MTTDERIAEIRKRRKAIIRLLDGASGINWSVPLGECLGYINWLIEQVEAARRETWLEAAKIVEEYAEEDCDWEHPRPSIVAALRRKAEGE